MVNLLIIKKKIIKEKNCDVSFFNIYTNKQFSSLVSELLQKLILWISQLLFICLKNVNSYAELIV